MVLYHKSKEVKFEKLFKPPFGSFLQKLQKIERMVIKMALQESGEMYLETIYVLSKKNPSVHSTDVGIYMGYSKPSVSRAVGILRRGGFLDMQTDGTLSLTEAGLEVAKRIYERHTVITKVLTMLGVDSDTAVCDACKIEHDISDESFEAIKRHLDKYGEKSGS